MSGNRHEKRVAKMYLREPIAALAPYTVLLMAAIVAQLVRGLRDR